MRSGDITVLFRKSLAEQGEFEVCKKYFNTISNRTLLGIYETVIGRYSVLPFYKELEEDLSIIDCKLINSYNQHQYVANIYEWYEELKHLTPKTWFAPSDVPKTLNSSFVLKGNTNSRKFLWKSHMFAETNKDIMSVYSRLLDDELISHQGIVIRQFEKFINFGYDLVGIPITKEFRFFMYKDKMLSSGYYWANHADYLYPEDIDPNQVPQDFIAEVASVVSKHINFWVMDVAQREDGQWRLVELNDGQMSGLSCNDADKLYSNLQKEVGCSAS